MLNVDAVLICSSTDTHVPLIEQAAQAGKHIFCEKPVSMDLSQTQAAVSAVQKAGVKLQIGFNRRFDHNFRRIRAHVQDGTIGDPHIIKITSRDPSPPPAEYIRVSGGIFMDMMIHDFDMARYLSGSEVEEVYAQGNVLINPVFAEHGDVDTAIVTMTFANGAIGVIDNSRQAVYGYDQRLKYLAQWAAPQRRMIIRIRLRSVQRPGLCATNRYTFSWNATMKRMCRRQPSLSMQSSMIHQLSWMATMQYRQNELRWQQKCPWSGEDL